jgi:SAM-dependent methyltransferase
MQQLSGTDADRAAIAYALDVGPSEAATRAHVHGFHAYPARMHPLTAQRLIERLSSPGGCVLDPFCGSGTVLVEARLLQRQAWGLDTNPIAVELAWLKARGTTAAERRRVRAAKDRVVASAESRRAARAGATRRYGPDDVASYDPHVLLELDGLRAGVERVAERESRRVLRLVLSSILTKVSHRRGETAQGGAAAKRIAAGFAIRLFSAKTEELLARLADFEARLARRDRPECAVWVGDARTLDRVASATVDLVVTSPPYAGTYDYLSHHAPRLRWLGMDAVDFEQNEIGARRHLEALPFDRAMDRWERDLGASLVAMSRVLKAGGTIALLVADSVVSGRSVRAADLVRRLAPRAGLAVIASGSQDRPHFHGPSARAFATGPRKEHALLLRPVGMSLTSNSKTS